MFYSCGARPKRGKFPAEDWWIYPPSLAPVHRLKRTGFFNDSGCGFISLFHTPKRRVESQKQHQDNLPYIDRG
jgi:hypothetical protein